MTEKIKKYLRKFLLPHGKDRFLMMINSKGSLLDVGCGNNSPYHIKSMLPDVYYTGIDIGDYNQEKPNIADKYILTDPDQFADTIAGMPDSFDAVISSHNLEHCNHRDKTLDAMIKALKPGGFIYLAFPTEKSVNFPSRKGTLNYFDDTTHKENPPDFNKIIKTLNENDIKIIFASSSYKPFILYSIGFLLEHLSMKRKTTPFTWAYYGFEAIIWAKK